MPVIPQTPQFKAKRFAALLAGFDTGNSCEAEAMSKGLALRRMAAEGKMRIVDLLELPEVRRAIDDQMQPKRKEYQELQVAMEQAGSLREELTERTRDVRKLADLLKKQKEKTAELREKLQSKGGTTTTRAANVSGICSHSFGVQSCVFEISAIVTALVLIFEALFR